MAVNIPFLLGIISVLAAIGGYVLKFFDFVSNNKIARFLAFLVVEVAIFGIFLTIINNRLKVFVLGDFALNALGSGSGFGNAGGVALWLLKTCFALEVMLGCIEKIVAMYFATLFIPLLRQLWNRLSLSVAS